MSTILPFPNVHGLRAPLAALPADALEVLARYRAKCRRRLSLHPVADDVATMPASWQEDIWAVRIAAAGLVGVYASGPMPLPEEPWHLPHMKAHSWPWGEHSRPGPLTEATIDRHVKAKMDHRSLGKILLDTGAMTWHRSGKPPPTLAQRVKGAAADRLANLRAWWVDLRIRLGLPL